MCIIQFWEGSILCKYAKFQNLNLTSSGSACFRVPRCHKETSDKKITRIKNILEFNFIVDLFHKTLNPTNGTQRISKNLKTMWKLGKEAKMCDLSAFFYSLRRKLYLKIIHNIKLQSRKQVHRVDAYGAPVFAPNYSATDLVAEMWTNHHEHSI